MRGTALVLTVAFVFLSTAVLIHPVVGQSSSQASLSGTVCPESPNGYPKPYGGAPSNGTNAGCQSQQGLAGATLYLSKPGPVASVPAGGVNKTAQSDAGGQFAFKDVATGDYTLTAVRTGFATDSQSITLSAGANRRDVALTAKEVTVTGTVSKASDGQALSGAELVLCCASDAMQGSAVSGSDGRFAIKGKAGWQTLTAHRSGYQDFNSYQLFDGGAPVAVAMEPIPPQDANLHGVVRDQHDNPVPGADLYVSDNGGCCYPTGGGGTTYSGTTSSGMTTAQSYPTSSGAMRPYYGGQNHTATDAQGRYSIHVYSGETSINANKQGYASVYLNVHVDANSDTAQDIKLQKYPAKTAHVEGHATDAKTGKGLRWVQVSVQSPEFGLYECSVDSADAGNSAQPPGKGSAGMGVAYPYPGPYTPGCAITVQPDGRYSGDVTPGYAIVTVTYESWRSCSDSHNADGSSSSVCGPEYNTWARSLVLKENATTTVDAGLKPRPAADAVVSGYLVDSESGLAIAGGQISFSNEDTQGYGYATTDADGSYKLRLRSGYHDVYAHANGHLHWQGVLDVRSGETPFDVKLTPGTESSGGCCYGGPIAMGKGMAASGGMARSATASPGAMGAPAPNAAQASGTGGQGVQYQDLGGGLGPYKASERNGALANDGNTASAGHRAPALGLLPMLAAIAAVLAAIAIRRRL